jgi:non-specific serine/threonine protein kinase/serine/threonine-protein kinase
MTVPIDPPLPSSAQATELLDATQQPVDGVGIGVGPDIAQGARIGRYRVERTLGRGGMGVVVLAEQTEPIRRHVAIKLVAQQHGDRDSRARFDIERQALARMTHPGIAQIFDAGSTTDGVAWFAMEYVVGRRLDVWWREQCPNPKAGIRLLRDICRAVGHAHRRGVVHCDLKPANLLIAEVDGQPLPKVIDFGIARATGQRGSGHVGGTPEFVSPEQAAGSPDVDARSDVHALGAILYRLLSGRSLRPWLDDCDEPTERVFQRIAGEPVGIGHDIAIADRTVRPGRGRELAAIILRAIAHRPSERYEDAHALADDLDRWLEHRPVHALPATLRYRWGCALRRHRLAAAVTASFAMLVGVFSWQLAAQYRQTLLERDTAEQMVTVLLETFSAADPMQFPEGSISARALLAGSSERIGARVLAPTTRARVLHELGKVQHNLEIYDDARATLLAALAASPDARNDAIELLLARVDSDAGAYAAARERATAVASRHADARNQTWASALVLLADNALLEGDRAGADAWLTESRAKALQDAAGELAHDWYLVAARAADGAGERDAALSHYGEALTIAGQVWGDEHARTLTVLNDLALATARVGRHEEAIAMLGRVAAGTERAWGRSAGLATVYGNLGTVLLRAGRPDEAEPLHRDAVLILEQTLGHASLYTGTEYNNLAAALEAQGRAADALPWFEKAERSLTAAVGDDHMRVGITQHNHARALLGLGRTDEALALLERSGAILSSALGTDHPRWHVFQITMADALRQRGDHAEAKKLLESALPSVEAAFGPDSREVQRAHRALGQVQAAQGDCAAAAHVIDAIGDARERRSAEAVLHALCRK